MYLYFDNEGILKEIITERPFRNGDDLRDKIYIYWEGEHSISEGWVKYRKPNGTMTNETLFSLTKVGKELPTNPIRNLEHFNYNHTYIKDGVSHIGYEFFELTVPNDVLTSATSSENLVLCVVRFVMADETINQLGVIPFSVETNAGILTDTSINESQYNYLLKLIDTSGVIQVQSDWDENDITARSYIKNKPTSTQMQSDWNETDATKKSYIQNKPTIPSKTSDLTNDSGFVNGDYVKINETLVGTEDALTEITRNNVKYRVEHTEEVVLYEDENIELNYQRLPESNILYNKKPDGVNRYKLEEFDYIVVFYVVGTTTATNLNTLVSEEIKILDGTHNYVSGESYSLWVDSVLYIQLRYLHLTNTNFSIEDCYRQTVPSSTIITNNTEIIPYKIIGYKYSKE